MSTRPVLSHPIGKPVFRHAALLYAGDDGFLAGTVPFVQAGLREGEPVLAMVGSGKIDLLREALGADAEDVHFADMHEVGANPARIIPAWRKFVDEHGAGERRLRGIGEPIWPARSEAELIECQRHEALLNLAFADGSAMWLLCPYDTDALAAGVIDEARHSHPFVVEDGVECGSSMYPGAELLAAPFATGLEVPPDDAASLPFVRERLNAVRDLVAARAEVAGIGEGRRADLVVAVNEAATNSVVHGGGEGILLVWQEGDALICEVRDHGHFDEPLAGGSHPRPDSIGGHGMWLVNQLCDLVQVRSFPTGTVVRMHMRSR